MITDESRIRQVFAAQAVTCRKMGSPFTAMLCDVLAHHLDCSDGVGRAVLDWQEGAGSHGEALPLRLASVLHALVLRGEAPHLKIIFPPRGTPTPEVLWACVAELLEQHEAMILEWLHHPAQAPEVELAGVIYPGLKAIAAATGLPLALYEVGARAGFNLLCDRYSYQFGAEKAGMKQSPIQIRPVWQGALPAVVEPFLVRRLGCDHAPLDVQDTADRERLLASVWPDQRDRLHRLIHVLKLAVQEPPSVMALDAAQFVEQSLSLVPEEGVCRVLMHALAFQGFSEETKARIRAHLSLVGLNASRTAPLALLSFEVPAKGWIPRLTMTLWPEGRQVLLAEAHPQGHWINWN